MVEPLVNCLIGIRGDLERDEGIYVSGVGEESRESESRDARAAGGDLMGLRGEDGPASGSETLGDIGIEEKSSLMDTGGSGRRV